MYEWAPAPCPIGMHGLTLLITTEPQHITPLLQNWCWGQRSPRQWWSYRPESNDSLAYSIRTKLIIPTVSLARGGGRDRPLVSLCIPGPYLLTWAFLPHKLFTQVTGTGVYILSSSSSSHHIWYYTHSTTRFPPGLLHRLLQGWAPWSIIRCCCMASSSSSSASLLHVNHSAMHF